MKIIKSSSVDWINSNDIDSQSVQWIPIFTIQFDIDYKRTFGLTSNGLWMNLIVMGESEKINVAQKNDFLSIITVLEKDRKYIESLLVDGLKSNTDGGYTKDIFPFLDVMKYAIKTHGGSWANKAINWLKQEEFDDELCVITEKIIVEKLMDQKTRHYLFKLMKRYERTKKADNI